MRDPSAYDGIQIFAGTRLEHAYPISDVIRDAVKAAQDGRFEEAFGLMYGLAEGALDSGLAGTAVLLCADLRALVQQEAIPPGQWVWFLNVEGGSLADVGRADEAIAAFQEMRVLGERLGDKATVATADLNLGNQALAQGDTEAAVRLYSNASQASLEQKDGWGAAQAILNLAMIARDQGKLDEADEMLTLVESVTGKTRHPQVRFSVASQRGAQATARSQFEAAEQYYRQALRAARRWGDRDAEVRALQNLGSTYMDMGRPQRALRWYRKSLALAKEMEVPPLLQKQYLALAVASHRTGRNEDAAEHFAQAAELALQLGDQAGWASATADQGVALLHAGKTQDSIARMEAALVAFRELGDAEWQAKVFANLFAAKRLAGDVQHALVDAEQSLRLLPERAHHERAALLKDMAEASLIDLGIAETAVRYLRLSLAESDELDPLAIGREYALSGALLSTGGSHDAAVPFFEQALGAFEQGGDRHLAFHTRNDLAIALTQLGRFEEAEQHYQSCLATAAELRDRAMELQACENLSEMLRRAARPEEAVITSRRAIELAGELGDNSRLAGALSGLGISLEDVQEFEEAGAAFHAAYESARRVNDSAAEAMALRGLANEEQRGGRYSRAVQYYERAIRLWSGLADDQHVAETVAHVLEVAAIRDRPGDIERESQRLVDLVERIKQPSIAARGFVSAGRWYVWRHDLEGAADLFAASLLMGVLDSSSGEERAVHDMAVTAALAALEVHQALPQDEQELLWNQVIQVLNERYDNLGEAARPIIDSVRAAIADDAPAGATHGDS